MEYRVANLSSPFGYAGGMMPMAVETARDCHGEIVAPAWGFVPARYAGRRTSLMLTVTAPWMPD